MSEPQINPEWVALLERDLENAIADAQDWLWAYSVLTGILSGHPGWKTAKNQTPLGRWIEAGVDLAKSAREKIEFFEDYHKDSSLERLFPFTAEELAKLKALNEDKAKTIAAYCRMASLDKWRVRRLLSAIDQYLSEDGHRDASSILTNARADAVNAKASEPPPAAPGVAMEWNKEKPTGPLKKYSFDVPDEDADREYCTGYNHGLIMAEAAMEQRS